MIDRIKKILKLHKKTEEEQQIISSKREYFEVALKNCRLELKIINKFPETFTKEEKDKMEKMIKLYESKLENL